MKPLFSYLPVSLFGSVMGLSGLFTSYKLAASHFDLNILNSVATLIGVLAIAAFIVLLFCYSLKIITSFEAFKMEFSNPLLKSFFGTFIISLLLLPLVLNEVATQIASVLWILGTILMVLFAVYIVSFWLCQSQNFSSVTPAWIIPVVGCLDIPLAMNYFAPSSDIGIFAISVGLFFAVPIFAIVMIKLLFNEPMPDKLAPTLMILIAPFAVGFSAYVEVVGGIDIFAKALYFIGLFLFFALLPRLKMATKCCPFRVTWWAVSFPAAALLAATLKMAENINALYLDILAVLFLVLFTLGFIWLAYRTLKGVLAGELKNLV